MRRLSLLALLLSACYRKDALYCDDATPCRAGLRCALPQHECVGEGVDMAGDLAGAPDLSMEPPDLTPPPECSSSAQCLTATRPICSAGRCQPCRRNYECPGAACDDSGACHDKGKIIVVDDNPAACRRLGDSGGQPYCYLAEALKDPDLARGKDLILLRPSTQGGHRQTGDFIKLGASVRLVGARDSRTAPQVVVREPLEIRGATTVVGIDDLAVTALDGIGSVNGVFCSGGATLTMRWSRVDGAQINGVLSENCTLRLLGNQILRNATEHNALASGVTISGGEATLYNNIVALNGFTTGFGGGGVSISLALRATLAFNTLAGNRCFAAAQGCNLACNSTTDVSYSILPAAEGAHLSLAGLCRVSNSVLPAGAPAGSGNLVGVVPAFVNAAQGDFHLSAGAVVNQMLRRPEPSPVVDVDVDFDPRPAGSVDIGADQLP